MASVNESAASSSKTRVLPSWGSSSVSSTTGSRGSTKKPPPSKKESTSNSQKLPTSKVYKNSRWYTLTHGNHKKATLNHESDNQIPQKDTKRILSSYLQNSSSSNSNPTPQRNESYETNDLPASSSHTNFQPQDSFSFANNDVSMKNNNGRRLLPAFMNPHGSVSATQYAGQSGNSRPVVVQETVGDERLIYQVALRDLYQPTTEATLPEGLLSIPLFRHQKIALAWMLDKENSVACSGGILADDQGLGKTISVIALIQMQKSLSKSKSEDPSPCASKSESLDLDNDSDKDFLDEESNEKKLKTKVSSSRAEEEFHNVKPPGGTLVVCPASVLQQWDHELDEKVSEDSKLKVLIYHGGNRTNDPDELANYDVVLTTYSIVAKEVPIDDDDDDLDDDDDDEEVINKKRKKSQISKKKKKGKKGRKGKGALAKVNWHRVILDEAQTIKNFTTQVSNSCCALKAKKRWCLSGTPIQNSIDELFSYFRFLKCEPYSNYKSFCNLIKNQMSKNTNQGNKKLQAVLKTIMLRRTKNTIISGTPIINLPPKTIKLTPVDFSKEERAFYTKLESESRARYKAYQAAGTVRQNYANILLMLLRLRQACDHPLLVKGVNSESVSQGSRRNAKKLPEDVRVKLLKVLESLCICVLCSDPPEDAVVGACGHVFCHQCVSEYLTRDDDTCPEFSCNYQINDDVLFSKATLRSCVHDDDNDDGNDDDDDVGIDLDFQSDYASAKIKATLDIIQSSCKSYDSESEGPIKAIVFSQWTRMLDLVQGSLDDNCVEYRRLDGSMTLVSRDRAVKEFNTDPQVIVMLMSLKAGNVGLNMVAASHVILLDLWWNPATEDQAIDRAHRIGQTRPVTVTRLTIKDTVEDRILALQEEKRKMVSSAFGEDQSGSSGPGLTAQDLKSVYHLLLFVEREYNHSAVSAMEPIYFTMTDSESSDSVLESNRALDEPELEDLVAPSSNTSELPEWHPSSIPATVDDERQRLIGVLHDLNDGLMIEATLPDGLLSVSLFKHQKVALAWMLMKENNVASNGGFLADDQGLGKTVSVIALIQMQKFLLKQKSVDLYNDNDKGFEDEESDEKKLKSKVSSSRAEEEFHNGKPSGGTLVVCPASVLQQWAHELDEKVSEESKLKVLIYHGGNRPNDPDELANYDVVLTTYSIVAKEVPTKNLFLYDFDYVDDDDDELKVAKKRKKCRKGIEGTLAKVNWFRVILDEAQTIKNDNTQVSKSCCGLRAKKRWCLSGTPIQNSVNELFSYFRFLKHEPYSDYLSFYHILFTPISSSEEQGYRKLHDVLKEIMLRRTKDTLIDGKPIIALPPKPIHLTAVDFSIEERAFYLKLEAESCSRFKAYHTAGTVRQNYRNILSMLLRLRQACNHPLLVKGFTLNETDERWKVGVKMVAAASHIIVLDPCWNPGTEDQVVDRAYGIGQTRDVRVSRIVVKDTVEARILQLQEEKRKLHASVFGL
ncbi:hypothetical protein LXL04_011047 [Taraxacum kok-saghyz]